MQLSAATAVSKSQHRLTAEKLGELSGAPGFADAYLADGAPPAAGKRLCYGRLADTLDHLARAGLDDFYRGDVARTLASDLEAAESPLTLADLEACHAAPVAPSPSR